MLYDKRVATTISNGKAVSEVIKAEDIVPNVGMVIMPAAWTSAALGFLVSDVSNGVFVPLRTQFGALVEITGIQTGATAAYPIPDEVGGAHWIKLWSENAGSDANQAAERAIILLGKG